jgi:YjjG family noncanonical pyrimidine nucleotidase
VLRGVLFDLDDTLFDHHQGARAALQRVHATYAPFLGTPFAEFEHAHAEHLEALHLQVLSGAMDIDAARVERFRRLLIQAGAGGDEAAGAAALYRESYIAARQAVAGAHDLLAALRARARIAVVSNNLLDEQQQKMAQCGLTPLIDALIVSEDVGFAKPDRRIFAVALDRLELQPEEAVMIGDSWPNDIVGATQAGIAAVWFNPRHLPVPGPNLNVPELYSFHPADHAVDVIVSAHAHWR